MTSDNSLTPGKCPGCGAINNIDPGASTYICECCGKLRAVNLFREAFEEQEKRKAARREELIPTGEGVVDVVSRKHIFDADVKPRVQSSLNDYDFGLTSACTNQLLITPYTLKPQTKAKHNSNQLHAFESELDLYEELAVNNDAKNLIKDSKGTTAAYAYILTCMDLNDDRESINNRYSFLPTNYSRAAEALGDSKKPLSARLRALEKASEGMRQMTEGDFSTAHKTLEEAISDLEKARSLAKSDFDFSSMVTAMNEEITACSSCLYVAEALESSLDDEEKSLALQFFGKLMRQLDVEKVKGSDRKEILDEFIKIIKSVLNGERMVKVAQGKGDYLVPMWEVDVKYTFQGGSILKKKAMAVTEKVLMSACFMTARGDYPTSFVTDIFGAAPKATFSSKIKGVESLSAGKRVIAICESATRSGLVGVIVAPTCTKSMAEEVCNDYIKACKSQAEKLRMSKTEAKEIIYIPCDKKNGIFVPTIDMGDIPAVSLGDPDRVPSMKF